MLLNTVVWNRFKSFNNEKIDTKLKGMLYIHCFKKGRRGSKDIYGISVWLVCLGGMSHCVSLILLPLESLQATNLIQLGPAQKRLNTVNCPVTDPCFPINT